MHAQRAHVVLTINGERQELDVDTRSTLLDVLREQLGLTGAKKGCDHGQCGACTILLDGYRANSCLALAVAHDGADVVTVEGLANGWPSAVTPDVRATPRLDEREVRERMSGNLCRCGAYVNIVAAVTEA